MKIMHCCLAAFYIDGYGYQENILPRAHRSMGHSVEIVASTETYVRGATRSYTRSSRYVSGDGIPVTRLDYVAWLPAFLSRKLRLYRGLKDRLDEFKPDIIFLHDLQFLDVWTIRRYARATSAKVYVDSHTDGINSARSSISKYLLHGLIYRLCAKIIEPVTTCFYPTLPLRMEFMIKTYGLKKEKMRLLPFGVDDVDTSPFLSSDEREDFRQAIGVRKSDILLVAGGKIDSRKNIISLLRAFRDLRATLDVEVKLLLFGTPDEECAVAFAEYVNQPGVISMGWLSPIEITRTLQASDLAIFPGTHSVLWEEAVGLGVPCVFKRWHGIDHVDIGGNCVFIEDGAQSVLSCVLKSLLTHHSKLSDMTRAAQSDRRRMFSYSQIAIDALSCGNVVSCARATPEGNV